MLPRHWELRLVDLNVEPLTDEHVRWADYVFLRRPRQFASAVELVILGHHFRRVAGSL